MMKETNLQAVIDIFYTFVHKKGWSITEEKILPMATSLL